MSVLLAYKLSMIRSVKIRLGGNHNIKYFRINMILLCYNNLLNFPHWILLKAK